MYAHCCRLFPSTDNIEPVLLITLAAAVIECLMDQDSRVLWVPPSDASEPSAGRRISIKQACFEREPNPCVTAVARHCGMDVPDISVEIFKVGRLATSCTALQHMLVCSFISHQPNHKHTICLHTITTCCVAKALLFALNAFRH